MNNITGKEQQPATPIRINKGATKYGPASPWQAPPDSTLTKKEQQQAAWLSGHSLAQNTWNTYNTAGKMFKLCCKEKNLIPSLPINNTTLVKFVLWLACDRKVSHATAKVYLSGIKQLHIQHGVECPNIYSDTINNLMQGLRNAEFTIPKENKRNAATAEDLRTLKKALTEQARPTSEKRLIWAASTLLFFGAFRASEILCRDRHSFDPSFCLCKEDVKLEKGKDGAESLRVSIKMPKEEKLLRVVTVDIFKTNSTDLCPVEAWKKWRNWYPTADTAAQQPHFRWENGAPLTITELNTELKKIFGDSAGISSHSFRIGAGHSDTDIQAIGRWQSSAFKRYTRKGRASRSAEAKKFSTYF